MKWRSDEVVNWPKWQSGEGREEESEKGMNGKVITYKPSSINPTISLEFDRGVIQVHVSDNFWNSQNPVY